MAGKKRNKRPLGIPGLPGAGGEPLTPEMLEQLLEMLPEDVRSEIMQEMAEVLAEASGSPPPKKPKTRAQREIDRLLEKAADQSNPEAALPLLIRAEAAARQALGKRWDKLAGHLGDDPAGRVYMEVKADLIEAHSMARQTEAAVGHAEELLRLDPEMPIHAQFWLLAGYFDLGRNADAERLLRERSLEPCAAWQFGRVLSELRRGERGRQADELLKQAHLANPFVVGLILGFSMPLPDPLALVEVGAESEAQEYAAYFLPAWKDTPGAVSWLRDASARLQLEVDPPVGEPEPPRRLTAQEYAEMPPHPSSTWVAGVHEMPPIQMPGDQRPQKRWLVFALTPDDDVVGFDMADDLPGTRDLWDRLVEFMLDERNPGRPDRLLLHPADLVRRLRKQAERARIELAPCEDDQRLGYMLEQLAQRMQGGTKASQSLDPDAVRQTPLDVDEVWEAALVQLEQRITIANLSIRPSVAIVMSRGSGVILWHELFTEWPPDDALSSAVRMAIVRPSMGAACRPRQVAVRDHDQALSLSALSDEAGFTCTVEPELPLVDHALSQLSQEVLGGETQVVLTAAEGVTPSDLEAYYTAAAAYYRAAPWKRFAMDEVIALDRQPPASRRYYALVMGQSGITQGLAVYFHLADIKALFVSLSELGAYDSYSVMFGEDVSIAPADLDAIEQFGWPVATPEAYPDALRVYPDRTVETPTAVELRFLSAALTAVSWLSQHPDEKSTTAEVAGAGVVATRLGSAETLKDRSR